MSLLAHDNLYSLPDMSSPARDSRCLVVGVLDAPLLLSIALVLRLSSDRASLWSKCPDRIISDCAVPLSSGCPTRDLTQMSWHPVFVVQPV